MTATDEDLLKGLTTPSDDVDLELLLMLARFEASVRWGEIPLMHPEMMEQPAA